MKQEVALLKAALIVAVALELELTGCSKQQTAVADVSEDQVFSEESKSTGPMNRFFSKPAKSASGQNRRNPLPCYYPGGSASLSCC